MDTTSSIITGIITGITTGTKTGITTDIMANTTIMGITVLMAVMAMPMGIMGLLSSTGTVINGIIRTATVTDNQADFFCCSIRRLNNLAR